MDYLDVADRTWPILSRLMRGHAAVYRATGGRVGARIAGLPPTEVQVGSRRLKVRAREATPEERRRLWPQAATYNPPWGRYRERTSREIPLVLLEPR